ncbi:MAG: hypothetical protein B6244_12085 [Candidatus Cloacimonetes bacterium 4572_55]|nr:MAG: hypothetical protein B6244_12085 [Candidatus Cloacimonetes bacterium 4572_55]
MFLSREAEYAIQALLRLTLHKDEHYVSIKTLAKELNISEYYLSKILQKLVKKNILKSHKGPKGGIAFFDSPEKISMLDIVVAIDGKEIFEGCVLGLYRCESDDPCSLHERWLKLRDQIQQMFSDESLAQLGENPELIRRSQKFINIKQKASKSKNKIS